MNFYSLSKDYHLRKCYFLKNQVPTQSVMKDKMSPALADVYFNSMTPKLKVLAGIQPPIKGGGESWYISPESLLQGRCVMKPLQKEHMTKLNYIGVDEMGMNLVQVHQRQMYKEIKQVIEEGEVYWKGHVAECCVQEYTEKSGLAIAANTQYIQTIFNQFTTLYKLSLTKLQDILYQAAAKTLKTCRENAFQRMQVKYEQLLQNQAIRITDRYTKLLTMMKIQIKQQYLENLERRRTEQAKLVHDINLEKHVNIEKTRKYLECQKIACQVYVALKEYEKCSKDTEISKQRHSKKIKLLSDTINTKGDEIRQALWNESECQELNTIWMEKVCQVVQKLQMFVSYCMRALPEQGDFFINMEKLMFLQLSEALKTPSAESIFKVEEAEFNNKPHSMYLLCDQYKIPVVNDNNYAKHDTSNIKQLPAIVINKKHVYATCDNFEQIANKTKNDIQGEGSDSNVRDNYDYSSAVPVKYSSTQQLLELKLESSLMQILQDEIVNTKKVSVECLGCKIPHCFDCYGTSPFTNETDLSAGLLSERITTKEPSGKKMTSKSETAHTRSPKWDSYINYVKPRKCDCSKVAKKHLQEHLPVYMRKMSDYDAPRLPNYKICPPTTLKALVKNARGETDKPPITQKVLSTTREMGVQCGDEEFDYLCLCFKNSKRFYDAFPNVNITPEYFV